LNKFFVLWEKERRSTAQACIGGSVSFEKELARREHARDVLNSIIQSGRGGSIIVYGESKDSKIIKHFKRQILSSLVHVFCESTFVYRFPYDASINSSIAINTAASNTLLCK